MTQYIDKDALVAEITHKIKVLEAFIKNFDGISDIVEKAKNKIEALGEVLLSIENLEAKEVDLEKGISDWLSEGLPNDEEEIDYIKETAKHFFELGMQQAQKGK